MLWEQAVPGENQAISGEERAMPGEHRAIPGKPQAMSGEHHKDSDLTGPSPRDLHPSHQLPHAATILSLPSTL